MKKNFLILLFTIVCLLTQAQTNQSSKLYPVAFYNLENLYHPESTDSLRDRQYTPEGDKQWTMHKYGLKLDNMAYAISQIAKEYGGPIILGVSEIGNKTVLEDLIKTGEMASKNWGIIHYDSPDRRGVDVGLLYDIDVYKISSSKTYAYKLEDKPYFRTRDQLLVSGTIAGEPVHVIVNHWPSRYGSKSGELRDHAATITKHITDSIRKADPTAKVIIMGDLNDDPTDNSCKKVLGAKKRAKDVKESDLYNTMWPIFDKGVGSLCYQGKWNLFDQIIISGNLLNNESGKLKFVKAEVFNKDFLMQKAGKNKGYPLRTHAGGVFLNGYSDHFPTLIYLTK